MWIRRQPPELEIEGSSPIRVDFFSALGCCVHVYTQNISTRISSLLATTIQLKYKTKACNDNSMLRMIKSVTSCTISFAYAYISFSHTLLLSKTCFRE